MSKDSKNGSRDGGLFGTWIQDDDGLPVYKYTCNQAHDSWARTETTWGYSTDHFHQLGNDRIAATAHNGGYVQVLDSSRGFHWMTYRDVKKQCLGGGICYVQSDRETWSDEWTEEHADAMTERIFGIGYFKKVTERGGLKLTHVICIPFSDDPVVISEVEVENTEEEERSFTLYEYWGINLWYLTKSLVVTSHDRKKFGTTRLLNFAGNFLKYISKLVRQDTDSTRRRFNAKFDFRRSTIPNGLVLHPRYKGRSRRRREEPSDKNYYPKPIFFSSISDEIDTTHGRREEVFQKHEFSPKQLDAQPEAFKDPCMVLGKTVRLQPKQKRRLIFVFGVAPVEEIDQLISKYREITEHESILKWNAALWKKSLIQFKYPESEWLARELQWHSYYLRSAGYFDEFSQLHKYPQGSVYEFGHGFDGAIRDYAFFLHPLIFIAPKLAREFLIYNLKLMKPTGQLPYGIYGFGKTISASVHSNPSDLYIFLLWSIIEYVYLTRDFEFLTEEIPFYETNIGGSSVLERIVLLIEFLFSPQVGFGSHHLLKVNDGDWSDGISLMVKNRRKFMKQGESLFNSAFAIYVLMRCMPLFEDKVPDLANVVQREIESLKEACLLSWNGRWFYRGWDGKGRPIGDQEIFLEHHPWLLLGDFLPESQAQSIINEVHEKLDRPSKIGQFILYPPVKTKFIALPPGWDVNGGIWHAMNYLLTWAYAFHDPAKAWTSLWKNSMANRAMQYPHIWYGIWSGPDSYIAGYASRAGQAFYHLATPMTDWPVMNLNLHACFLSALLRLVGVESTHAGLTIMPKLPSEFFSFKSVLLEVDITPQKSVVIYRSPHWTNLSLSIRLPEEWEDVTDVLYNGSSVKNDISMKEGILTVILKRFKDKELRIEIIK